MRNACTRLLGIIFIVLLAPPPANASDRIAVAVMEFRNTSADAQYQYLEKALRDMLTTDLAVAKELQLVERARLDAILAELKLARTKFIDSTTAARIGKGLGAQAVLLGTFTIQGGKIRIDARLVHVASGRLLLAGEATGNATDLFDIEKRLAKSVIRECGAKLSSLQLADVERMHTQHLKAAATYGRALAYQEAGDLEKAAEAAKATLNDDPDFALAKRMVSRIDAVLEEVRGEQFDRDIGEIVEYEWELPNWRANHSRVHLPAFDCTEYQRIYVEGSPQQALQYWASRLCQRRTQTGRLGDFFELTFMDQSGRMGIATTYAEYGGPPGLFWHSVYEADPEFIPSGVVTNEMLHPDPIGSRKALYRAMYLKRYVHVLLTKYVGEIAILGDFERATKTLDTGRRLYAGLQADKVFVAAMQQMRDILDSPEERAEIMEEFQGQRLVWSIAKQHIIVGIANRQSEFFAVHTEVSDLDKERSRLVNEYANGLPTPGPWNSGSARRGAQRISDRLLKEAGSAEFVGRKSPIFKGGNTREFDVIVEIHIAGCPHAQETRSQALAFGGRTAMHPGNPNPLLKLQNPDIALETGHAQCPHCMPLRWLQDREDLAAKVRRRLAVLTQRSEKESSLETGTMTTQAEVEFVSLLGTFLQVDLSELRSELHEVVRQNYHRNPQHFGILRQALRALGTVATEDDVPLLAEILHGSPHWDLRLLAAGALGSVKHPTALTALRKARETEPFYFVRHAVAAAELRATTE